MDLIGAADTPVEPQDTPPVDDAFRQQIGKIADRFEEIDAEAKIIGKKASELRAEASGLKNEILDALRARGVEEMIAVDWALKVAERKSPQPTLKNLKGILGAKDGKELWDKFPKKTTFSLALERVSEPD